MLVVETLIEYASHSLNRPFSYVYKGSKTIQKGYRVLIEFNHREIVGYVLNVKDVHQSRSEIEESLSDDSFETFMQKMIESGATVNFDNILKFPILNSRTKRKDIVLDKNGVQVCLSFDNSLYTNHALNEISSTDRMIEIEAIGELNNRIILNEIHDFITSTFSNLEVNKQSKYERGINRTLQLHNYLKQQQFAEKQSFSLNNGSISGPDALIKRLQKSQK